MLPGRRIRIKGIANIPVRRKNIENDNSNGEKTINQNIEENSKQENEQFENANKNVSESEVISNENILKINEQVAPKIEEQIELTNNENVLTENNLSNEHKNAPCKENVEKAENSDNLEKQNETQLENSIPPENKFRRWVSKPVVRLPTVPRKIKFEETQKTEIVLNPEINKTESNNTDIKKDLTIKQKPLTVNIEKTILNDTSSELSITPLSPNKTVNRARIRPVPRLIRRNSVQGSASESEDDGRKSRSRNDSISSRTRNDSICSRTRNDSVCSVANSEIGKDENVTSKENKFKNIVSRKLRASDQSRKISLAKREFYLKFGQNRPDRKKLTMMDLIFYNPTTNPMPEKPTKNNDNQEETIEIINDDVEAEKEDNPDDPVTISDEENIPVPQVKVGPDGEIVLDEQSLVIEQTGIKKGREQIANSQVVIDDLDTGYGIYKRPKKGRDWSISETLRFYRTLNTVGTDFSLMLSLFPGRTRRDLKLKFKKEEKLNRALIDKVLMNPLDFDLADLEKQFQEEETMKKNKNIEVITKFKKEKKIRERTKTSISSRLLEDVNEESMAINIRRKRSIKKLMKKEEKNKKDSYTILQEGYTSLLDSESDQEEIYKINPNEINEEAPKRPMRACRQNAQFYSLEESSGSEIDSFYPECIIARPKIKKIKTEKVDDTKNDRIQRNMLKINNESDLDISNDVDESSENLQMDVETNIVIAHSENNEPDKISIDIFSKDRTGIKANETKVSLDLNKEGDNLLRIENYPKNTEKLNIKSDSSDNNNQITDIKSDPVKSEVLNEQVCQMEPGSLMILSNTTPTGEKYFQVYMVTPDKKRVPIDLSPDVVSSLTTSLGSAEEVSLDLPVDNKI